MLLLVENHNGAVLKGCTTPDVNWHHHHLGTDYGEDGSDIARLEHVLHDTCTPKQVAGIANGVRRLDQRS